jgi:hypothetical protein
MVLQIPFMPAACQFHTSQTTQLVVVGVRRLAGAALELLSEEEQLGLVVQGQHTGTGDTTEDVGAGALEERADTLGGDDLAESVEGARILDSL